MAQPLVLTIPQKGILYQHQLRFQGNRDIASPTVWVTLLDSGGNAKMLNLGQLGTLHFLHFLASRGPIDV